MRLLRGDRAATDPILVIAAIAVSLVLLVGGSFAVAGALNNSRDLNAKTDLDKVATAEAALAASGKSLADPTPVIRATGTIPDPAGASAFSATYAAVNAAGVTNAFLSFSSTGQAWIVNTSAYLTNGTWTPQSSRGTHSLDANGKLVSATDLDPNSGLLYDLSGVSRAPGAGAVTLAAFVPNAVPGFAPYLSGQTGKIGSDLSAGGAVESGALAKADLGFTPSDGTRTAVTVSADGNGWAAVSKSSTGKLFIRTSAGSSTGELGGTAAARTIPTSVTLPTGMTAASVTTALTNAGGF